MPTHIIDATTSWHTNQHHEAADSANQHHRCHYKLAHTPTPRNITINPQSIYTGLLNTIPPHTILATRRPPRLEIYHSDLTVTCQDRVHLSSFRCCTHLHTLPPAYIATHSLIHIMTHCPALSHTLGHNII